MCGGRSAVRALITAGFAALLLAASASAGQIVYTHGHDLWVVNDNGTGQRPLLTAAQIGGNIGFTENHGDVGVSVQPNGDAIAFTAEVNGADGACASNCPGLYSFLNGKPLRLSQPASACGGGGVICGSEQIDPAVTTTERVIYYTLQAASTIDCGIYYCGSDGGLSEDYVSRKLDGSDSATPWPLPSSTTGANMNGAQGADPVFEGSIAADPADPNKIAYGGDYIHGIPFGDGCGTDGDGNCYPLVVDDSNGTYTRTSTDDSFYYDFAFSQDGTKVADLETGDKKGIWVYPSTQDYSGANPQFSWALTDPDNVDGATQFQNNVNGLTFVGNNEIVFSSNNNLYSIPASCWATPTAPSDTSGHCSLANAHQLTHDGNSTAPDAQPAWTSSTSAIKAFGTTPPPPSGNQITKAKLGSSSVKKGKPVVIDVTLKRGVKVSVEVLRYVPASGHGKHRKKAHYKKIGTLTGAGTAGLNKFSFSKVAGHRLAPGKYELLVSAGGKAQTLKFKVKH
jgi:hypothetical protein